MSRSQGFQREHAVPALPTATRRPPPAAAGCSLRHARLQTRGGSFRVRIRTLGKGSPRTGQCRGGRRHGSCRGHTPRSGCRPPLQGGDGLPHAFVASLSMTARKWEQPKCPSADDQIKTRGVCTRGEEGSEARTHATARAAHATTGAAGKAPGARPRGTLHRQTRRDGEQMSGRRAGGGDLNVLAVAGGGCRPLRVHCPAAAVPRGGAFRAVWTPRQQKRPAEQRADGKPEQKRVGLRVIGHR